jgi:probable F420-dependent oxidoreductase
MKFWCGVSFLDPNAWLDVARTCDECDYHALMVSDHLVMPEKLESQYPYSSDGTPIWDPAAIPWLDPWVAIGAMAAVTERLTFSTNVYIAPARHPLVVAKAVATAAVLSGGRVSLGVGVGWMREEFAAAGQEFTTRGRRLDEMIEILRALWAGGFVEHHGRDYDFDAVSLTVVPPAPVPIYVGGESEPALRRAARNDGWIGNLYTEERARAEVARLRSLREEAGTAARDDYEVLLTVRDHSDVDVLRRLEDAGVTGILCAPWMPTRHDADMSPDAIRARLESFAERVIRV